VPQLGQVERDYAVFDGAPEIRNFGGILMTRSEDAVDLAGFP
jgi:hypothetical protein